MKFKSSKKLVSLFLAIMMVVTSVPAFTINASAAETDARDSYLFAYFTGDDDTADAVNQRVRFALSKDGVNFTSLNGNSPILTNDKTSGTITWKNKTGIPHTKGVRDPFIIKKPNEPGYYIVATDLRVGENGGSYNNSKLVVWDVNDLSKADKVAPWIIETSGMFGDTYYSNGEINNDYVAWAPEVTYDYETNMYMIYWSGPLYKSSTILCAYTRDFKTFYQDSLGEKPLDGAGVRPNTLFSESGQNTIDADIVYDSSNRAYYMVYKRESERQIYFVKSDSLDGFKGQTGTKFVDSRYSGLEGPELYKRADGKWTLIADRYTENGGAGSAGKFAMYVADSIDEFMTGADQGSKEVTTNINECSPRHGAVTTITSAEYTALNEAYGGASESQGALVARYFTSSDTTADTTGHGYNVTFPNGGVSYVNEFDGVKNAVHFNATQDNKSGTNPIYAKVRTADMMSKYNFNYDDGMTITFKAYDELNDGESGYTGFFTLTETPDAIPGHMTEDTTNYSHYDTAYMFLLDGLARGISSGIPGSADNGSTVYASDTLGNQWVDYKIVISGDGYKVYRKGEEKASMTSKHITDQWYKDLFDDGTLLLGTTLFSRDLNYKGYLADFRIYSTSNQGTVADLAAKQDELDAKQYVIDNINNTKSYAFDAKIANADDKYMKNIIYSGDWADSSWTSFNNYSSSTDNKHNFRVSGPSVAVGIYSGNGAGTDIRFPLISETGKGGNQARVTNYIGIDHLAYNEKGPFNIGGANWERCNGKNDLTSNSDTSHNFSSDLNGGIDRKENSSDQRYQLNENKTWKNYMTYNGSGNESTYYDVLTNPSFAYQADYTWTWTEWFTAKWGSRSNYTGTVSATNQKFYVLNYKPLKELIESPEFKSNFQDVVDNEWKYDETALIEYYKMYRDILKFDLKSCDYSSEAKIINVATTIKNLTEGYYPTPKKKQITVNFSFDNGDVTTKKIDAGSSLAGIVPSNTEIGSNNNGTHRVYTWSDDCSESTIPQKDTTYFETFENVDCTFGAPTTVDGVTTEKCTVCGYTKTVINLNKDAYNAAVESANAEIANTAKNTAESIANLQAVLNDNSYPDSAQNQKELDAMTSAILDAIAKLELNTYTVNLYYVIDGTQSVVQQTVTDKYGKYFTFNAPDGNYSVEKWTRTIGTEKDEKVGATNTSLTGRIVNNADYFVYAKSVKPAKTNYAVVSLKDRLGRVVDNMYVPLTDGKATLDVTVNAANRSITVNGTTMTAPNVTFYAFKEFEINGKTVTDGTYTITGNTTIKAVYGYAKSFEIKTVDCKADYPYAYWDQKVTVTADNATDSTQWYVNDELVGYGKTYTFRANADVTVTCKNETTVTVLPSAVVTRLSYNNPVEKTITAVAQLNVPEGYTVKEAGVLLKTSSVNKNAAVDNIENYTGSNRNARKFKANNFVKDTNQYVISVYASKSYDSLYVGAVAYVTYTDANGHESTNYSNLVTYDYKA